MCILRKVEAQSILFQSKLATYKVGIREKKKIAVFIVVVVDVDVWPSL